ncbi:hypothetical protein ACP0HM_05650 [Escherichia coli]
MKKIWIKASISPVYDVLAHLQNPVMTFSDITEERQIRQLEGNILAAMCSSPPFHEMGKSFVVTSNLYSTNRMFRCSHCATGCRYTGRHLPTVQKFKNAQSWSATIRQRDGAPAGILQIKNLVRSRNQRLYRTRGRYQPAYGRAGAGTGKSRQHIEQLIQFDPMTGLPNRNNLHNYLDDRVDKAVSPVVYLIGVDHIQGCD